MEDYSGHEQVQWI